MEYLQSWDIQLTLESVVTIESKFFNLRQLPLTIHI